MTPARFLPRPSSGGHGHAGPSASCAEAVRAGARIYLSAQSGAAPDGTLAAPGDAAAQTNAAIDRLAAALAAAGASLAHITKLTTSIVDRAHRRDVYRTIRGRLGGVYPVSTGLVVAGLPAPELMVQIDAEALAPASGAAAIRRYRTYDLGDWHGQNFAWQGAYVAAGDDELFVRGQTGSPLDGTGVVGLGRRPQDAAEQADLALRNLALLLAETGCGLEEIAKITVYISDRAYRTAVYPVIGEHLRGIHPVATGLIVPALARPELLFELDVHVLRQRGGRPHLRLRPYHTQDMPYGGEHQPLACDFCMAVRAGNSILLRGQTGMALDGKLQAKGDASAQAEQAMRNVAALLGEAGARLSDVVKASVFVTDRAYLADVSNVVLGALQGVNPAFGALIVKGLASPELLMEVDITAVVADEPSP